MTLNLNDISTFDYIIAGILTLFLLRGLCIGFVRQLAATAALVGSYWLAGEYVGQVMPYVEGFIDRPGAVFLVSFGSLFLLSALVFTLIGSLLHKVLEISLLGWANRLTGGLLGVARGGLVTVLLFMLLAAVLPAAHPLFEGSLTVPYLSQGAEIIRQFIRNVSVRDDLKPMPPEEIKGEQEQKKLGKEQLPVDGEKVKPVTIPDETEPQSMPVQQEEINDERSEETGTAPR
ncbi:MAG: membrane protein required for colicin V production [Candidatus Electronema aureum]|uniref:Membrane protein required for colicin V production n=1 Tax=Candidatus Electronema aureum TaxID=2005002 RepID=A0A521G1K0_9BACT|nr:MAG: membrane protein required for colicin V production [Candidatus Electronema aureum]